MNLLLNIFIDTILPLIILAIGIICAIFIYKATSKKYKKKDTPSPKQNAVPQVTLKERYCTEEEMKFLETLHKTLPRDCISFPHVGLAKLIEPKNNLVDYQNVSDKHVDICVFLRKDMKPILVIDLYQQSPVAQQLKKMDTNTINVLKQVKIPVVSVEIQNSYDIDKLRIKLIKAMDNATIIHLKDISLQYFDTNIQ